MKGINKVILVGNLGQDPETRNTQAGGAITNISIATTESWTDKQSGQKQDRTEWHRVVFFNRLAEIAAEYLRKGSQVYVEGSLRTRKWQDQQGQERYTTEVVAAELQMLGGKPVDSNGPSVPQQDYRGHTGSNQPSPADAPSSPRLFHAQSRPTPPAPKAQFDELDDIPFD